MHWCIELGRIDIVVEVGLLARFQACPRKGHLEQLFHVFAYLKKYHRSSLVFDWTEPELDESRFKDCDWREYYPDAAEAIPDNMPEPRGKGVTTSCFVDADHAGCRLTRRSHSGVLIFVNRAPIIWFSKRQATVESSTFGSESIAMRQAIDLWEQEKSLCFNFCVGIVPALRAPSSFSIGPCRAYFFQPLPTTLLSTSASSTMVPD